MNIYLVSRRDRVSYDEYDSFIVAAPDEETARYSHPSNYDADNAQIKWDHDQRVWLRNFWDGSSTRVGDYGTWTKDPTKVDVNLLGTAVPGITGVLLASFNAG